MLLYARRIDLSDPALPESRQPYHAADETQGELEMDERVIAERLRGIRRVTSGSIETLLAECRTRGGTPKRAVLVVGSVIDPTTIHHPHIRAHAMDGRTFRIAIEEVLRFHKFPFQVLTEKTAFDRAAAMLGREQADLRRTLAGLRGEADGPWRSEEKYAALAAWVALAGK